MYRKLLAFCFLASAGSLALAIPFEGYSLPATDNPPSDHQREPPRAMTYLLARQQSAVRIPFWPFPTDSASTSGLAPITEALLAVMSSSTQPIDTSALSTSLASPSNTADVSLSGPSQIPTAASSASQPAGTILSDVGQDPVQKNDIHPAAHNVNRREWIIIATILATIGGICLCIIFCRSLTASRMCGWGVRKEERHVRFSDDLTTIECANDSGLSFGNHYAEPARTANAEYKDTVVHVASKPSREASDIATQEMLDTSRPLALLSSFQTSRSSIPSYRPIAARDFFQQLDAEEKDKGLQGFPSKLRFSVSSVLSRHSRVKSAPVVASSRPVSNKSGASESEWDIARAYGGPRYDKARSAGATSDLSWESRLTWNGLDNAA